MAIPLAAAAPGGPLAGVKMVCREVSSWRQCWPLWAEVGEAPPPEERCADRRLDNLPTWPARDGGGCCWCCWWCWETRQADRPPPEEGVAVACIAGDHWEQEATEGGRNER